MAPLIIGGGDDAAIITVMADGDWTYTPAWGSLPAQRTVPTGCPLLGGLLDGTTLVCQCQGFRFDIATGAVIQGPATGALEV